MQETRGSAANTEKQFALIEYYVLNEWGTAGPCTGAILGQGESFSVLTS